MDRNPGYCATRSVVGKAEADKMFGRELPSGLDMDQPGDEAMVAKIVEEEDRCDACLYRAACHEG